MIQRKFYLPEDMYTDLQLLAKATKKPITQVLRELLEDSLKRRQKRRDGKSCQALLKLAEKAESEGWKGPADLSVNHDKYLIEILKKDLKRTHDYYR